MKYWIILITVLAVTGCKDSVKELEPETERGLSAKCECGCQPTCNCTPENHCRALGCTKR